MERSEKKQLKARILEIQRMSTEDGPGIRTTVFFKGCSLKCRWCHNPESISPHPEIQWIGSRCIGCHTCTEVCPEKALTFTATGLRIDRAACRQCGVCVEACPSTAMEQMGAEWQIDDLYAEVIKDRAYFEQSGGGVTVSGGEPGLQAPFVAALLERLRCIGIHTALDTCGLYRREVLEKILPHSVLVLFDIKEIDPVRHSRFTGHENGIILENLKYTADYIRSHLYPRALWIRTPIIPGATDRPDTLRAIGGFIAAHLQGSVARWELCAFNNLCRDKYKRLDLDWEYGKTPLLTQDRLGELAAAAKRSGVDPDIVFATGATRPSSDSCEDSPMARA